ncbi:MAG: Bax inhibitor-1 family protein [Lachnospiraceae bacterium]|nr:Bax inhibitor-1 family protein [Lachnospiraceae bacterium]
MARESTGLFENRKLERLYADYDLNDVIDRQKYNLIMGGVVIYGLVVNLILCKAVPNVYDYINPILFLILYLVSAIAGTLISAKSDDPIVSFIGYNLVVVPCGLVVSMAVEMYGGLESELVTQAFTYTLCITGIMIAASMLWPSVFETIGRYLIFGLVAVLAGSLLGILFNGGFMALSWFAALLFSLYIGYDFYKAQQYTPTLDNAVDCALDIYLDIINLFLRILRILGRGSRRN